MSTASITIECDDQTGAVNFIVCGEESKALKIAEDVMNIVIAAKPKGDYLGCETHYVI